jgi:hypothetical protein
MFWSWDEVEKKNLYPEFANVAKLIELSDFAKHASARKIPVKVATDRKTDLAFAPGMGWGRSTRTTFDLPADALNGEMVKLAEIWFSDSTSMHR